jgi:hypothetical protein
MAWFTAFRFRKPARGRAFARTRGKPLSRPRPQVRLAVESLEDRTVPSVVIAGAAKVAQGLPYQLDLASDAAVSQWSINWGDANTQTVTGNPSSVSHTYTTGTATYPISASALVNNNPVAANVSAGGR